MNNHSKKPCFFEVLSAVSDQDSDFFLDTNSQRNSHCADQTNSTMNERFSLSLSRISSSQNPPYNICDNSFSLIQDINDIIDNEKMLNLLINLQSNVLQIKDVEEIVSKIDECNDNIQYASINLNNCLIGDEGLKILSESLIRFQYMTKLHLILQSNNITDQGLCYLWQAINQFDRLKELDIDLSYNKIQGSLIPAQQGQESFTELFKCFFSSAAPSHNQILYSPDLIKLHLNFESNHFTQKGIKYIIESLKISKYLNDLHINLRKNNLDCFSLIELSQELGQKFVSTLYLDIGNNKITVEDANIILFNISQNFHLENLTIDLQGSIRKGCKSSGVTLKKEIQNIQIFNNVSQIDLKLGWNSLDSEEFINMLRKFKFCDKLTHISLDLANNNLGDKGVFSLHQSLSACTMLKHLNLNYKNNQMSDKGMTLLGETIKSLNKLQTFYTNCEFNNLTVESIQKFNLNVQKCVDIKNLSLNLQQSNLSDSSFERYAEKMQRFHSAFELQIAFNARPEQCNEAK